MILEPKKIKSVTVSIVSPSFFPLSDGVRCHDLSFLNVEFYASFSTPFSYSSRGSSVPLCILPLGWCHLHIWGYWYLLTILIPPCATSSPVFRMMYSAYKLNKQGDNIQPWYTPFPTWNQSVVLFGSNYLFLTCIQVLQETGKMVRYYHLFENFPQFVVIYTIKQS